MLATAAAFFGKGCVVLVKDTEMYPANLLLDSPNFIAASHLYRSVVEWIEGLQLKP